MEIDNLWNAEHWDPEKLMELYKRAGAKYFVALANHHDNFDNYDSKYHAWNSVNVGPKKDIVGTWAKVARAHGLRFGVSNHSVPRLALVPGRLRLRSAKAPLAGVRYDAVHADQGRRQGQVVGRPRSRRSSTPARTIGHARRPHHDRRPSNDWHNSHDRKWNEEPPPNNPAFADSWFLRCQDLVDKYQPDLLYFDNTELPLGPGRPRHRRALLQRQHRAHDGKLEVVAQRQEA